MATILRHRRKRDFTVLPNGMLRDKRVSFRATGLLAHLLMLPDGACVDSTSLSEERKAVAGKSAEGREAVRTAFRELEAAGYLTREKVQDERGRWSTVLEVVDEPKTGFRSSGDRGPENRPSDDWALKAVSTDCAKRNGGARTDSDGATFLPGTGWISETRPA